MFSKLARSVTRRGVPSRNLAASFDGYGQHVFKGAVATPYLEKAGLASNTLDTPAWTSNGNADKVFGGLVLFTLRLQTLDRKF